SGEEIDKFLVIRIANKRNLSKFDTNFVKVSLYIDDYIPFSLLIVLAIATLIQLCYLLFVYSRLWRYRVSVPGGEAFCPPVSVIICARNEEENLRRHLPAILQQDYPAFEVVLVNDYSEDETKWM